MKKLEKLILIFIKEKINFNNKNQILNKMLSQETKNSIKNKMIYEFYLNEMIKE